MEQHIQDIWLILVVGTTVVLILIFAFIFTMVAYKRRLNIVKDMVPEILELKNAESTLTPSSITWINSMFNTDSLETFWSLLEWKAQKAMKEWPRYNSPCGKNLQTISVHGGLHWQTFRAPKAAFEKFLLKQIEAAETY